MLLKNCPVSMTLRVLNGKWKPLILRELKDGPVHFGQLRRSVPEATQKMLTAQLRQLMAVGIVDRRVIAGRVVRTEYRLSAYGQGLRPVLLAMAKWGKDHRRHVRTTP